MTHTRPLSFPQLVASLAQYEHEDATDKRLDEQAFASLIRRVGGVKESLKREAVGVDPRDAQALAGAFAKSKHSLSKSPTSSERPA